jgi:hypothetical protein
MFADLKEDYEKRGHNKENLMLALLLDIDVNKIIKAKQKMRGIFIREGQLKSDKFKMVASKIGATVLSCRRVTKPQRRLFELIRTYDKDATLEKVLTTNGKYRSYDIFSPSIKACIEMHGRVWHDLAETTDKLRELVKGNIINDAFKEQLAILNGYEYIVFWDDREHEWIEQVQSLYKKEDSNENSENDSNAGGTCI